jgi:integrase
VSTPQRAARRAKPVAYHDASTGVTVYKPVKPGAPGEDGAWRTTWRDPTTGRRRSSRLRGSRDQVVRQAKRIGADIKASRSADWREVSFRALADAYLADPDHAWEDGTRRHQVGYLATLCDETPLGETTLGELAYSPKVSRDALKALAATIRPRTGRPFAQSSLKNVRDLLGTVIAWGQQEEYLPQDLSPMKGVGTPKAQPGAKLSVKDRALREDDADGDDGERVLSGEIPAASDVDALAKVWAERAPGSPWWRDLAVRFAASTGPRWGEQHALRCSDFDFTGAPFVRIHRKIVVDRRGSVAGTSLPKMAKKRESFIVPELVEPLQRRIAEVVKAHGSSGLVFPSPSDAARMYEPDSFGSSMRRYAGHAGWPVDEHGLALWTWHSLRHHAASVALRDRRLDVAYVSESLGHASVRFTIERYVGTTADSRRLAWEQMLAATGGA